MMRSFLQIWWAKCCQWIASFSTGVSTGKNTNPIAGPVPGAVSYSRLLAVRDSWSYALGPVRYRHTAPPKSAKMREDAQFMAWRSRQMAMKRWANLINAGRAYLRKMALAEQYGGHQ